uniref:Uncharacterized protein n=1 Tax=Arundo donax TaxID=35708 RepID=A0A0A9CBK9_ARUDO
MTATNKSRSTNKSTTQPRTRLDQHILHPHMLF